jgi:hypothetical protein
MNSPSELNDKRADSGIKIKTQRLVFFYRPGLAFFVPFSAAHASQWRT